MDQIQITDPIPSAVMFDWATSLRKPKLRGKAIEIEPEHKKLSTNKSTDYYTGMSD